MLHRYATTAVTKPNGPAAAMFVLAVAAQLVVVRVISSFPSQHLAETGVGYDTLSA